MYEQLKRILQYNEHSCACECKYCILDVENCVFEEDNIQSVFDYIDGIETIRIEE